MILVVLAAGAGSRVQNSNFIPKPIKRIADETFLAWSIKSFMPLIHDGTLKYKDIFVVLNSDHNDDFAIKDLIHSEIDTEINVIDLPRLTSGPAETLSQAVEILSESFDLAKEIMAVVDCDAYIYSKALIREISSSISLSSPLVLLGLTNKPESEEHWSEVVCDPQGRILEVIEKRSSSPRSGKLITNRGVIGAYVFVRIPNIKDELKGTIGARVDSFEPYVSHQISQLISSGIEAKGVFEPDFIPFGTVAQIEQARDRLLLTKAKRELDTWFFDLDGTLIDHQKGRDGVYSYPSSPIDENLPAKISDLFNRGHKIVLTTARPEGEREKLVSSLNGIGLKFDQLVMGLGGGARHLVNDLKPDLPGIPTAFAHNLNRDSGAVSALVNNFMEGKLQILERLKGGSTGETFVLNLNGRKVVRKVLPKNGPVSPQLLKYQALWFETIRQFFPSNCPQVIDYREDVENEILDTFFVEEIITLGDKLDILPENQSQNLFSEFLSLINHVYDLTDGQSLPFDELKTALDIKALPSITFTIGELKKFQSDNGIHSILINNLNYPFVFDADLYAKRIENAYLRNSSIVEQTALPVSIIHGDLTLENVGVAKEIIFFDPIGKFAEADFDFSEGLLDKSYQILDATRIWLSTEFSYHQLHSSNWKLQNGTMSIDFSPFDKSSNSRVLSEMLLQSYGLVAGDKSTIFKLVNLLTLSRILKYKIRDNPHHALIMLRQIDLLLEDLGV